MANPKVAAAAALVLVVVVSLGGVPRSEEASEVLTVALNCAAAAAAAAAAKATLEAEDEAGLDLGSSPLSRRSLSLDSKGEELRFSSWLALLFNLSEV